MQRSDQREPEPVQSTPEVDEFLRDKIDTVPHLEALLLVWTARPKPYSVKEMADRLFLAPEAAKEILDDLVRSGLIAAVPGAGECYCYDPEPERDRLMAAVDTTYRQELIRVSRLIHSKPSAAIREFARAFRLKKERD